MNRQEFVAELLAALGGRVSTDETVQLTVGGSSYSLPEEWLYRAERRIASKHDFEVMSELQPFTLSDGQDDQILAQYTKSVIGVRLIDGTSSYELLYRPPVWFNRNVPYPAGEAEGKPEIYTVTKRREVAVSTMIDLEYKGYLELVFYPIPDTTYYIYVDTMMWPSPMSSTTSTSSFGEYFLDHVIFEYALGFGFSHFGEAYKKDAAYHMSLGDKYLEEMIAADGYVPAHMVAPEGYSPTRKYPRKYYALDAGSVPDGTVNPWR